MAEEVKEELGALPSETFVSDPSLTPTRDQLNLYLEEKTNLTGEEIGNIMGGYGRGFLDMGYADLTFVPGLMDSYDAFNRLQETKKNDDFTDGEQASIEMLPLSLRLASIGAGAMGEDSRINDYYDGKKMDIVTMYGGPLGVLGVKAGIIKLLNSLKGKVSILPGGMYK
jgi:hypothetical protein